MRSLGTIDLMEEMMVGEEISENTLKMKAEMDRKAAEEVEQIDKTRNSDVIFNCLCQKSEGLTQNNNF